MKTLVTGQRHRTWIVVLAALVAVLCSSSGAAAAASAIDRSGWTASSITGPAPQLINGSGERWSVNRNMQPGDWVLVDMGKSYKIKSVIMDSNPNPGDAAKGLQLLLSEDGKDFTKVAELTADDCAKAKGLLRFSLPGTSARYLKFIQTGSVEHDAWWSVYDVSIEEAAGQPGAAATATPPTPTKPVDAATASGANLALNKPITASSVYWEKDKDGIPKAAAKYAVDGDVSTGWAPEFGEGPYSLIIDLQAIYSVDRFIMVPSDEHPPRVYEIYVSTDSNAWTKVFASPKDGTKDWVVTPGDSGVEIRIAPVSARYVKQVDLCPDCKRNALIAAAREQS